MVLSTTMRQFLVLCSPDSACKLRGGMGQLTNERNLASATRGSAHTTTVLYVRNTNWPYQGKKLQDDYRAGP